MKKMLIKFFMPVIIAVVLLVIVLFLAIATAIFMPLSENNNVTGNEILGLTGIDGFVSPLPDVDITQHITSYYGMRTLNGKTAFHYGVDISFGGIYQYPLVAVADGVVNFTGTRDNGKFMTNGYGNYVKLDHTVEGNENTVMTVYGHMDSVIAVDGAVVKQGEVIGYVGTTGYSTGPHLHFEVRINGEKVDPLSFPYPYRQIENKTEVN